jgi:hypothetical protein
MIMRKLAFIFSIFISLGLYSQNFDSIMSKRIELNCTDVTQNSSFLFSHYMENNKIDSAKLIFDYWKGKCGLTEPTFRANVFLNLVQGNSIEPIIDSFTIGIILKYRDRRNASKALMYSHYDYNQSYYGFLPFFSRFDQLTTQIASEKINSYSKESIEYLLCEYYSDLNDSILYKLQDKNYLNTSLSKEYYNLIEEIKPKSTFNMNFSFGAWIPTGSMKKFGTKPNFSFEMGADVKKMSYNINISIRGNKSDVYYMAKREDTGLIDSTNSFLGGYMGFEVGRMILQTKKSDFRVQLGVGFDGFDVFEDKDKSDNVSDGTSIFTYNFNLGINYRYYIGDIYYIGAIAKYNIVDYRLGNIVNFSSNPFSLQLTLGFSAINIYSKSLLNRLNYKGKRR